MPSYRNINWSVWCVLAFLCIGSSVAQAQFRLVDAAKRKDTEAVRSLLKQRIGVDEHDDGGPTALAWAAHWSDVETAKVLISAGADPNLMSDYGVTPLWEACSNGDATLVELLVSAGAHPNLRLLGAGETALMTCANSGSVQAVKSLLAHGAEIDAKDSVGGQTALMWAVVEKHPAVEQVLIEHGADVHARSNGGFTPMLFAAKAGDLASGRVLKAAGANVNDTRPPRNSEAEGHFVGKPNRLAAYGGQEGDLSALLVATDCGHEDFAIFLVENGANVNAADAFGYTALHYSLRKGISLTQYVGRNEGYYEDSFEYLLRPNMTKLVTALLAHGANPNARVVKGSKYLNQLDNSTFPQIGLAGATPFFLAAVTGDVGMMRLLLANGADPNLTTSEKTTPLMAAAGIGRAATEVRTKEEEAQSIEALRLLIEMGADVNAANTDGRTAFHGAAFSGANEILKFLADKGAKIDAQDRYGQTALDIVEGDPNLLMDDRERSFHPEAAELIRKLGGEPLVPDYVLPAMRGDR